MRSINLKLWTSIAIINLILLILLGVILGTLIHDFHFDLKAEDLKMMGIEINTIYKESDKNEAFSYASAMAKHTLAKVAIIDDYGKIIMTNDKNLFERRILTSQKAHTLKKNKYYKNVFNENQLLVIVPDVSGNYSTFVVTPLGPITSTINQLWLYIFYTGIGVMIGMAGISYLISRQISFPLIKLNKEALKIADGDYDSLEVPESKDEIGQLSSTILYVAQAMKRTLQEREKIYQIQKDFLANISHDLRTPLSLIKGYAIALQQHVVEGQEKEEAINIIIDESDRMDRLTNELLDLAKLESGKNILNLSYASLSDITDNILKSYIGEFNKKNINIEFHDDSANLKTLLDEDRLKQVIINLLINALNSTPQNGEIKIIIKKVNTQLSFAIHNTGSYINKEEITNIWERFYKIDRSRSASAKGSGLGLPIVKGIITMHGGYVGVTSDKNSGTTFSFSLPIRNSSIF